MLLQRFENQFDNNSLPQRSLQSFVRMKNSYGTLVSLDRRIINEFPSNLIPNSSSLFFFSEISILFRFPLGDGPFIAIPRPRNKSFRNTKARVCSSSSSWRKWSDETAYNRRTRLDTALARATRRGGVSVSRSARKRGWRVGGGLLYQRHNYAVTPSGGGGPGLDRLAKIFEVSLAPNQAFSPPYWLREGAHQTSCSAIMNFAF